MICGECPAIFFNKYMGEHICSVMNCSPHIITNMTTHLPNCPIYNPKNRRTVTYCPSNKIYTEVFKE